MTLKDSRGMPILFDLNTAALIAGTTVPALRTRIARGLLHFVGERPLAGSERRFTIEGIYEIALADVLERNGVTQVTASQVVSALFEGELLVSGLMYFRDHPEERDADETTNRNFILSDPELWIPQGVLGRRDLSRPGLLLFAVPDDDPEPGFVVADGWEDIPKKAVDFQRDRRTLRSSCSAELSKFRKNLEETGAALPDDDPEVQSALSVLHVLNVTVVLSRTDARISEVLSKKSAPKGKA